MTEFVTVAFRVTADEAEEMKREAVYLDVFGHVRWLHNSGLVEHASGWATTSSDVPPGGGS